MHLSVQCVHSNIVTGLKKLSLHRTYLQPQLRISLNFM